MKLILVASPLVQQLNELISESAYRFEDIGNLNSASILINFDQVPWLRTIYLTVTVSPATNQATIKLSAAIENRKLYDSSYLDSSEGFAAEFKAALKEAIGGLSAFIEQLTASTEWSDYIRTSKELEALKIRLDQASEEVKARLKTSLNQALQ